MRKPITFLMVIALLAISTATAMAQDPTYTEDWDGRGTDSEKCELVGQGDRTEEGWIHWVFATKGDSTSAELILGGTGAGTYSPGEPLNANVWHFYTPFFELDGLNATINLFGGAKGPGGGLVISDFCPGIQQEELTVSKTAVTTFDREHKWDIAKKVETEEGHKLDGTPKIWLFTDGSGDEKATWTVDVTYEGYEDSNHNVSGTITIENTGDLDAEITSIVDTIEFIPEDLSSENQAVVDVDCGEDFELPYTLGVGESLECSYSFDFDDKATGENTVTVTTERDTYSASAAFSEWGDPATETNKTVNIQDISDLFGEVDLGTATAPNDATFTYYKAFAYADFDECGSFAYDNTATIVETNQSASAKLKVNVQCMIEGNGETAWAANADAPGELRYTPRGNWATYVEYNGEKTTTLFAGQTMVAGTVHFSEAVNGEVTITVELTGDWAFRGVGENLKVQDYAVAPSGNPAPGQFDHKKTCDTDSNTCTIVVPENNFYGVHVDVVQMIPDPDFGP